MSENFKDILSNLSTSIDQETLLLYLQGKLPQDKVHEIEKQLLQDEFNEDAVEGLQDFNDKEQLQFMVDKLNRELKNKTEKKKRRREKMKLKDQPWLYISVLLLIIILTLCFIVIRKMMN